jgi:hypothetical protein
MAFGLMAASLQGFQHKEIHRDSKEYWLSSTKSLQEYICASRGNFQCAKNSE